ncbi:uncharacterized protein LOC132172298 [Corylus avellana]|uniref:uncharacterized protein LOC132172298 n=1 Tax=Corylus avellana TaxID=13451 RepID=UPI00286A011C|nr:uncharacterized protein LOC132172298 [Corylus avellana]
MGVDSWNFMENRSEGIAWVGNMMHKLEAMCLEVDEIMGQDALNNVGGQLQTVGAPVRQFWSELMQDMLLPSSVDIQEEEGSHSAAGGNAKATVYDESIGIDEGHIEEGACRVDHLLHSSSVELVKGMDLSLSLDKNVDVGINGMTVEPEVGIKEIPVKEMQIQQDISDIIPPGNKDSSKDTLKNVGDHLQTVRDHVRQFWSEIMQDMLLPSSLDIQKEDGSHSGVGGNAKATAYVKPTVGIDEEEHIEEVPCRVDNLLHSSSVEPVKGMDIDLSLEKNVDIGINGMTIEPEVGTKEIAVKEKQIQHEISDIIPPGNKDSSKVLLSHQLDADNDMVLDCRAKILLPASNDVQGSNSFMKRGEEIDARACNSGDLPSPDSVSLVESCENKVMDAELSCGDTSAVSIRTFNSSIDEESRDDDVTKQGIQTAQSSDMVKLGGSCIMVESTELCSISCEATKVGSYKKKLREAFASKIRLLKNQNHKQHATFYEDLDTGLDQQRGKSSKSSTHAKRPDSLDPEFSESEWEIV